MDEVLALGAESVLEAGPGSGLVTDWLRRAGTQVTTLDIDPRLEPDLVAPVTDIPAGDDRFDAALCSQVLEHMPFDEAVTGLRELGRVSRLGVVVSLPDSRPYVGTSFPLYFGLYADRVREQVPGGKRAKVRAIATGKVRFRDVLFAMFVPREWGLGGRTLELARPPVPHGPWELESESEHFFEIGASGYPFERVADAFEHAGLEMVREFRVPENPWHHFFVARPRQKAERE